MFWAGKGKFSGILQSLAVGKILCARFQGLNYCYENVKM